MSTETQQSLPIPGSEQETAATTTDVDKTNSMRDLLKKCRELSRALAMLGEIDPKRPDATGQIDAALRSLPAAPTLASEFGKIRSDLETIIADARRRNQQNIGRIEAEFVRAAREKSILVREKDSGWRIGDFYLRTNKDSGTVQVLFNEQLLVGPIQVSQAEDFTTALNHAETLLAQRKLSIEKLDHLFDRAYTYAVAVRKASGSNKPEYVPLDEFYREVRAARVVAELGNSPDRKIKTTEMPEWEFLFLVDSYRAQSGQLPASRRLALHTGSQNESRSSKAMTLNGLDPRQDYKVYCYITRSTL